MPNTYTQIHIQFVFAVKFRKALIEDSYKQELYQYITGILQSYGHKLLAINGVSDHIHIFIGMRPTQSISDLMQDIKGNSSKWVNDKKFLKVKFEWQGGYGAFSYSKSHVQNVINSDTIQPGSELALTVEGTDASDSFDQHLLGNFFSVVRMKDHAHGDVVNPSLVTKDQLFQGRLATVLRQFDQLAIG